MSFVLGPEIKVTNSDQFSSVGFFLGRALSYTQSSPAMIGGREFRTFFWSLSMDKDIPLAFKRRSAQSQRVRLSFQRS